MSSRTVRVDRELAGNPKPEEDYVVATSEWSKEEADAFGDARDAALRGFRTPLRQPKLDAVLTQGELTQWAGTQFIEQDPLVDAPPGDNWFQLDKTLYQLQRKVRGEATKLREYGKGVDKNASSIRMRLRLLTGSDEPGAQTAAALAKYL